MQRKSVKGSVYEEILWLEVYSFDGRGNVALVDAKIINSSGRYIDSSWSFGQGNPVVFYLV